MKLGTDFSGIGAPEMALKYLNIKFKSVFACEIDKYARQSFKQLHNTKTFYNDITKRNHKEVEQLDLYVAGFPCQAFSMAGKRKGFEDTRGTLFYNVAEFIKINKPKVFVLENVKGLLSHDSGKTFQTIIDILSNNGGTQNGQIILDMFDDGLGYHIYWQVLNTKNYGIPQNRERIFIVGFKDFKNFNFPKSIKLKLKLKDLLQDNTNNKYHLSYKMCKSIFQASKGNWQSGKMTIDTDIAKTINARVFKMGKADTDNYITVKDKYYLSDKAKERLKRHNNNTIYNDISNCILAGYYKQGGRDQQYIQVEKKCVSKIKVNNSSKNKTKIRRLTPLECWRLQGFKDIDFFSVKGLSDTQLYKQAGNSITVNVLMALFKKILL